MEINFLNIILRISGFLHLQFQASNFRLHFWHVQNIWASTRVYFSDNEELESILSALDLTHLINRCNGFDTGIDFEWWNIILHKFYRLWSVITHYHHSIIRSSNTSLSSCIQKKASLLDDFWLMQCFSFNKWTISSKNCLINRSEALHFINSHFKITL